MELIIILACIATPFITAVVLEKMTMDDNKEDKSYYERILK